MRLSVVLLLCIATAVGAHAQGLGNGPRVYGAAAVGPGFGAVAGSSRPVGFVAAEAALYADLQPRVAGIGAGRLLLSAGAGGSVRLARAAAEVRRTAPGVVDLDVGMRIGPAFYVGFTRPTASSEARAFRVMTDAFVRGSRRLPSGRVAFAEVGTQAPALRVGLTTTVGASRPVR